MVAAPDRVSTPIGDTAAKRLATALDAGRRPFSIEDSTRSAKKRLEGHFTSKLMDAANMLMRPEPPASMIPHDDKPRRSFGESLLKSLSLEDARSADFRKQR
jgi:hypothetical protein